MALGKYEHEVLEEATPRDIARYVALRNIQIHEENARIRRENSKLK